MTELAENVVGSEEPRRPLFGGKSPKALPWKPLPHMDEWLENLEAEAVPASEQVLADVVDGADSSAISIRSSGCAAWRQTILAAWLGSRRAAAAATAPSTTSAKNSAPRRDTPSLGGGWRGLEVL